MSDYLWDKSGEPDPDIVQLENLLSVYRASPHASPAFTLSAVQRPNYAPVLFKAAVAAAILVLTSVAFFAYSQFRPRVTMTVLAGTPQVNRQLKGQSTLSLGDTVQTGPRDRARFTIGLIGTVDIDADSSVTLIENRSGRRTLRLLHGKLSARINAPPAVFVVQTSSARAVDLGCAYRLQVSRSGEGELHVSEGWVALDYSPYQTLVPAGYAARFLPGGEISPPFREDTTPAFRDALLNLWRAQHGVESQRIHAAEAVLQTATQSDSFTLLALLRHVSPPERALLYDRLAEFVPPPQGVNRQEIISGSDSSLPDSWWLAVEQNLGLSKLQKKSPLALGPFSGY